MPAMLDDPTAPTIYRTSGAPPYPTPTANPQLPPDIIPRQVTLRDRVTIATLIPFSSASQVPPSLLAYLSDQFNREIEKGDTYPMISPIALSAFGLYWFQNFGAVMLLGEICSVEEVGRMDREGGRDWAKECLGSFYIKPNYPGRSSHVCNGGFLVTDAARNRGVGRLMGEGYLEWAPKLGYTYSVFNLVYETNVASCRIWDALGFKRIGRVKGCGNLRSYPDQLIDAIIYGRDLGPEGEDFVSEERFDKIRFYLKHGKYPNGADRAEKSRLRSAATHYKLVPCDDKAAGAEGGERLMLKDKEVVADPQRQYEIARQVHVLQHGGINKTTATIAEKYHWVRIKETVSLVIKNCADCKEMTKVPSVRPDGGVVTAAAACKRSLSNGTSGLGQGEGLAQGQGGVSAAGRLISIPSSAPSSHDNGDEADDVSQSPPLQHHDHDHQHDHNHNHQEQPLPSPHAHAHADMHPLHPHHTAIRAPVANMHPHSHSHHHVQHQHQHHPLSDYDDIPLDPQIMQDVRHHLTHYHPHQHPHTQTQTHLHDVNGLHDSPYRLHTNGAAEDIVGPSLAASTATDAVGHGEGEGEGVGEGEDMVDFDGHAVGVGIGDVGVGVGVDVGDIDADGDGVEDVDEDVEGEARRQLIVSSFEEGVGVGVGEFGS